MEVIVLKNECSYETSVLAASVWFVKKITDGRREIVSDDI